MSSLFSVEGKVALVTGGSRGLGEMMASGLVRAGARVYIASRKELACEATAAKLGEHGECIALPADLSGLDGVEHLHRSLQEREPQLHILVNNAGATWGAPLASYPDQAFDKLWRVNVKAPFHLVRLFLPMLEAASEPLDPARVVNIGSIAGVSVPPLGDVSGPADGPSLESYAYSSSKAALHMLTRHLAARLAGERITVNAIAPGVFETEMTKFTTALDAGWDAATSIVPLQRLGQADDLVGTLLYLCSRAGAYMTGSILSLDGGIAGAG